MTLWTSLVAVAGAADPASDLERYPLCAEVTDLPATGPARLRVPLALRSPADPSDGSDLILVDASGRSVPFQRVEADHLPQVVEVPEVRPTTDPHRFVVQTGGFTLGGLRVHLPPSVAAARVTVTGPRGLLARDALVWRLAAGASTDVPFDAPADGALTVTVTPTTRGVSLGDGPTFEGLRAGGPSIPDHRLEVAVGPPVVQENGWARTVLPLPRPLPIGGVVVEAADPLFVRDAGLAIQPRVDPGRALGYEPTPRYRTPLTRATIGELEVSRREVRDRVAVGAGEELVLLVDASGKVPLEVTGATVWVPGVDLVALDAGAGPHRLCGGAPPGTTPVAPIGEAAAELARVAGEAVEAGEVAPNPAYVPPEVRSNLAAPSPLSGGDRLRWGRPVTGAGLVRIPVPNEVLAKARPDLGDLRLLVGGGERQVPYLLEREVADRPIDVITTREDRAGRSQIAVELPARGLRVSRITLRTEATTFDREVVVSVPESGARLRPIRAVRWAGGDRPGALTIEVGAAVDDELLVTIDNGDDPPLPVSSVEVAVAGHALIAVLPEGGATLAYGDPTLARPRYDLALLGDVLRTRAAAVPAAAVGDEVPRARAPLSAVDRGLLAVGIGALAIGLLLLAGDLVRSLRPAGRDGGARSPA